MLGTAYLSLTLEELMTLLPQVTEGGLEGTGMDYSRASGQVAKMMLRVRKQRVKEEQDRMKREFEEQESQQLFRRPLRPTPKKSQQERSARGPERSVPTPEHSTGDQEDEGSRTHPASGHGTETPKDQPERSTGRSEGLPPQEQEASEEAVETELSSFVGDEPPLFHSSGREEDLRIPKATKTTRRRLFQREEVTPIEAFKRVAKTLQVTIFEGTRATYQRDIYQKG